MAVNSKQKGNSGEREVAKMLSESLGGSFVRSNSSGAFIGGKNAHRKNVLSTNQIVNSKGDIVPPDNMPFFVIECKSYKEFRYHQLLTECPMIDGWLKQTTDTSDINDFWVLVFKANRMPWSIAIHTNLQRHFKLSNYVVYKDVFISDFKEFLKNNSEKMIEFGEKSIKNI